MSRRREKRIRRLERRVTKLEVAASCGLLEREIRSEKSRALRAEPMDAEYVQIKACEIKPMRFIDRLRAFFGK